METFDIIMPVMKSIESRIKIYPQRVNRASSAGHPCEKFLVYSRTKWKEKMPHNAVMQTIFDAGNEIEKYALRTLEDAGFEIFEQQRAFEWTEFELTGHLDCKIRHPETNKAIPLEEKSMSQFVWDKINCVEDFLQSKRHYVRGYISQLALYMLSPGNESELGVFYLINKQTWQPKAIWMHQDYTFAEEILKKLERVNRHVKENTVPEGIKDNDTCQYCAFLHVCLPDMIGTEIEIINEVEIEEAIKRSLELKPIVAEQKNLDKQWKDALKEKEKVMIGDYLITGKWIKKKSFTVPDSEYWQSKIIMKPDGTTKNVE